MLENRKRNLLKNFVAGGAVAESAVSWKGGTSSTAPERPTTGTLT